MNIHRMVGMDRTAGSSAESVKNRNLAERLRTKLKEWRAVATRYKKTVLSFMGVLCLAAACHWARS